MSQPSKPPPKKTGTRSRTGCWTCRARRKKCDEKRPECTPCVNKGLKCDGYGARLKWGNGVASRGHLTGATIPVPRADGTNAAKNGSRGQGKNQKNATANSSSNITKDADSGNRVVGRKKRESGRGPVGEVRERRDEQGQGPRRSGEIVLDFGVSPAMSETPSSNSTAGSASIGSSELAPETAFTDAMVPEGVKMSPFDEKLFQEFKEWGSFYLWVSADPSKGPFYDVLSLCAHSKSLLANCLTFQLSLHPEYEDKFDEYYAESLRLFRQDVAEPGNVMKDATLVSGILLCSISMTRCMTWTIHLNGMHSILQYRHTMSNPTAVTSDIVYTIGFLDLPTHILGRQTPTLNIWRDYCRGKSGIESVSGLPYNLIDLFSTIGAPDVEMQFWTWTGAGIQAKPVQRRAWDATRFAGIICARQQQLASSQLPSIGLSGPPTEVLVQAIVDCLQDLLNTPREETSSVINLLLFPAFIAGTQCNVLSAAQKCIEKFWNDFFLGDEGGKGGSPMLEAPLNILHEMWTNDRGRTADQIAREWGLEIGLF
ncbi:hypothetical protein VTO42DRAFT_5281 [Malbranchea cinnamomea]